MVKEAASKINRVGPRHTIYLQKDLVEDTAFPFLLNEPLSVKVEGERLVIERAGAPGRTGSDFIVPETNGTSVLSVLGDLGYEPVLSRAEKIYDMLKEVHEAETMNLRIKRIPAKEHAILLYSSNSFRDKIMAEFLDPSIDAPMGLLSEKHAEFGSAKNLLYGEMVGKNGSSFSKHILNWIAEVETSSKASGPTRIAIEDMSWFFKNDLSDEVVKWEREIGPRNNLTMLCGYCTSMLDQSWLRKVIGLHSYVILDVPFRVYRKGRQ
jgi:MEDS: MEthanogen/methylotroph, DcmR Sensory domain